MPRSEIQRAALGRAAKIGALYDIRTESFLHDTLFGLKVENEAIVTVDHGDTSIELVTTDSLQEKFDQLDVEAELQVSLLSGLVKLSGSGAYIGEERKSARAQSMSLLYKLRTVDEEIMIRQNKDKIDMAVLKALEQASDATHVVVGIDWGAVFSVTCEYENKEGEDVTKVKGALSAELEELKTLINVKDSAKAEYDVQDRENHKRFTFKCKADVSAPGEDLPVTFESAVKLAKSLPSLVKGTNNGKGVPLTYTMMPVDAIVKMCGIQALVQIQHKAIAEDTAKECVQVVEEITKKRQALYDIRDDMHAYHNHVHYQGLSRVDKLFNDFAEKESDFKVKFRDLVINVRSGHKHVSSLEAFLSKESGDTLFNLTFQREIATFQTDINRIRSVKSLTSKGIVFIGRDDKFTVDDRKNVFVFYKSVDEDDKENRFKNQRFFLRLQKTHCKDDKSYKFVIVDKGTREDLWPAYTKNATIYKFVNSQIVSTDLYAEEGQDSEKCLIEIVAPTCQQMRPANRTYVELPCPNALSGNAQCTSNPTTWLCSKCKKMVEYGIETKQFYCKCGESDPKKSLFRCSEKDHGMAFIRYQKDTMQDKLLRHSKLKDINILILGETGVGKSTWINGFQNYLHFEHLEEAINAEDFHVLIPSSFTFTREGKPEDIFIGEMNKNENLEAGESATKQTHSYVFRVGEYRIRLIDTPGIGTTAGIEQDKKNFDNILSYLSYFDDIHAIFILLKPNNSRLTAMFKFCIQELLAHLHSSVKGNIVFCFTNARATFYQPGDTLPALRRLLRDRNVGIQATPLNYFCFDNEPFRFLAGQKHGLRFSEKEKQTYAESWDKSVDETKRLFEYIQTLQPHKVKNTMSLNEARRIIVAMSKPLAQVAKIIELNLQKGQKVRHEIDKCDKDMEGLKERLKFSGFDLKHTPLKRPRTVCAHPACVSQVKIGEEAVQNTVYKQVCHDNCTLDRIVPETTNVRWIRVCRCFLLRSLCRECGHKYTDHMHITYNTEIVRKEFLSREVQAAINEKRSFKEAKEEFKRETEEKCAKLKKEEKFIMETCAKYGSFLKANAIIPYNDAVFDYLDMSIEQETNKAREIRNNALLERMQAMKETYQKERDLLDKAIGTQNDENIKTPEEVFDLMEKLCDLTHMGKTLRDMYNTVFISNSANNTAFQETVSPFQQSTQPFATTLVLILRRKVLSVGKGIKTRGMEFVSNRFGRQNTNN